MGDRVQERGAGSLAPQSAPPQRQGTPGRRTRTEELARQMVQRKPAGRAPAQSEPALPMRGPLSPGTIEVGELVVRQLDANHVIIELGRSQVEIRNRGGAAEAYDFYIERPTSEHQRLVRITATRGVEINEHHDADAAVELVVHDRRVDSPGSVGSAPASSMWLGGVGQDGDSPLADGALSDSEVLIIQRGRHAHTLSVDGSEIYIDAPDAHAPYAFDLAPAWSGPEGRERVVHIVATPGVRVTTSVSSDESFRARTFRRSLVANVIRAQDPNAVPAQGTRIMPGDFLSRRTIPGIAPTNPHAALDVVRGNAGVTVREAQSQVSVRIYPKDAAVGARFAYEIIESRQKREIGGTTEIRALVARDTQVEVTEPRLAPPLGADEIDSFGDHNVRMLIYEARDASDIPPQGARLDDALLARVGTRREPVRRYAPPTLGQTLALGAADTGMSVVPGVGDVYDLIQFGKSSLTGTDLQGRPVSDRELVIMGVAVLLPLAGAGLVRTAAKATSKADALAGQLGRTADELQVLFAQIDQLTPADRAMVRRVERAIEQGKHADADDIDHLLGRLEAVGFDTVPLRGVAGEPAAARSPWASLGEGPEVDAMHVAGKDTTGAPRARDPFAVIASDDVARLAFERLETAIGSTGPLRFALAQAARHAAEIEHPAAYLAAVERLFKARPGDQVLLARLILPSTKAGNSVEFLDGATWLAKRGLSEEALKNLVDKIADGGVLDPAWLRKTRLSLEDMEFLALDTSTDWQAFLRASRHPSDRFPEGIASDGVNAAGANRQAYAKTRGVAAEFVGDTIELPGGFRVIDRQPEVGGAVLDNKVMDARGQIRAMEIKGWRPQTWEAYLAQSEESSQMRRLITQLKAGYETGAPPVLALSDAVDSSLLRRVRDFMDEAGIDDVDIIQLPESEILATARRLRKAMGIK